MEIVIGLISLVITAAFFGFIGWLIYRAVKGELKIRQIKAHVVVYAVACVTGVFTLAFFLTMDIPQLIKIVVSIFLGIALIILAAYLQRRQPSKP